MHPVQQRLRLLLGILALRRLQKQCAAVVKALGYAFQARLVCNAKRDMDAMYATPKADLHC